MKIDIDSELSAYFVKESEGDMIIIEHEEANLEDKRKASDICQQWRDVSWFLCGKGGGRKEGCVRTCVLSVCAAFNRRTVSPCSFTRFNNVFLAASSAIASTMWHVVSRDPIPSVPTVNESPYGSGFAHEPQTTCGARGWFPLPSPSLSYLDRKARLARKQFDCYIYSKMRKIYFDTGEKDEFPL